MNISILYKKNILGVCIQDMKDLFIVQDIYDTHECDILKDIIHTFDIQKCFYSLDLKECQIEFEMIVTKTYENLSVKKHLEQFIEKDKYKLSISCLSSLLIFFNCPEIIKEIIADNKKVSCENRFFVGKKVKTVETIKDERQNNFRMCKLITSIGVYNIHLLDLRETLFLSQSTMKSLYLLKEKRHPNINISTKKDFSVIEKIDFTQTTMGKSLLKLWVNFPLLNIKKINERREIIDYIINNSLQTKTTQFLKMCVCLEKNNNNFYQKNKKSYFFKLRKFLMASYEITKLFKNVFQHDTDFISDLIYEIDSKLDLNAKINSVSNKDRKNINKTNSNDSILIPFDKSKGNNILNEFHTFLDDDSYIGKTNINFNDIDDKNVFIIKEGIIEHLDTLKKTFKELPEYLDCIAKKVSNEKNITVSIIYYPQIGYLIETKSNIEEWICKFKIKENYYYKNEFMNDLDSELGDILTQIYDIELEILNSIRNKIVKERRKLDSLIDYIAIVDCINSLATSAIKYNLKKSDIIDKNIFEFKDLRCILNFDFYGFDFTLDSNCILTGPNSSGKSSLLRTIGISIILNQIGSFIPCKQASMKLFDKIFTKMASNESLNCNRSAFASDMSLVREALNYGSSDSIFLIDELGKGTNIIDGTALFLSICKNSRDILVISTTHLMGWLIDNFNENKTIEVLNTKETPSNASDQNTFNTKYAVSSDENSKSTSIEALNEIFDCKRTKIETENNRNTSDSSSQIISKDKEFNNLELSYINESACFKNKNIFITKSKDDLSGILIQIFDNYCFKMLEKQISSKKYTIKDGICTESLGLELMHKFNYPASFYDECIELKKKLSQKYFKNLNMQENDNNWAVEIINDVIFNAKNT
ncbi:DNA mismatch repair protein MutS [Hamiltosporidium tvaerminnensis]|uniref:DNA mismatch repair protein MutS n=2 Tax=Hamiltosporidium TaxID=1176354 RepID=A0A4Q9M3C1_9MICR|nr:DNA mismatch repair protein MutS [Hamiltosporidium tvaerminnensis]